FEKFELDPARRERLQTSRTQARFGDADYDLVTQTLPSPHGLSATLKLVNRATFIKDFTTLGMELEDRVRLVEALRTTFRPLLVPSPAFSGANPTAYSVMHFLQQGQRDVLSLESPILWRMDGARQVEVEAGGRMEETLRSVMAVRPDVLMLSSLPDRSTAQLA